MFCEGRLSPRWASVNNAIFVCLNCAGFHRGLGVQFSFMKSTNLDSWKLDQLNSMKIGGN